MFWGNTLAIYRIVQSNQCKFVSSFSSIDDRGGILDPFMHAESVVRMVLPINRDLKLFKLFGF